VKRLLANAATIGALMAVVIFGHITPGAADGTVHHRYDKHHAHVAYVEYVSGYGACRTGWWQTLRYGHVRPRWGTWCR
jgi:hypothetical protein